MERLHQLLAQLDDVDDVDRAVAAITLLENEATREWLPVLRDVLTRPGNFFLREGVAPAVIKLEGFDCLQRLLHALRTGTREGHDNDGLSHYVIEVVESSPREVARLLACLAQSAAIVDREDAAWLFGFVAEHVAPEMVIRMAADPAAGVRSAACGSLPAFQQREDVFEVLRCSLSDADEQVRVSAISALGYYGDERALPLLANLDDGGSKKVRSMLDHALSELRSRLQRRKRLDKRADP